MKIKRLAMAVLAFAAFANAVAADTVPASIQKSLKPYSLQSVELTDGVLRIIASRPMLNWEMYESLARWAVCGPIYEDNKLASKIKKVEVFNQIGAQGFAFSGGGKSCLELGKLPGDKSGQFFKDKTEECIARVCRMDHKMRSNVPVPGR